MGTFSFVRPVTAACLVMCAIGVSAACDHRCGLGEHARVTVTSGQAGPTPCCGGSAYHDVALRARTSDAEFSLSNTAMPTEAGGVDAYIVPTSCPKLFDGAYPGAAPLCTIFTGPAKPGGTAPRVKLAAGTYRIYLQGYSNVAQPVSYLVDVYVWDYSCGPLLQ